MDRAKLQQELLNDEGLRLSVYKDSLGIWTLGAGRNVDPAHGGGITREEALYLLGNDIDRSWQAILRALPWAADLSDARQRALVNMSFMGVSKLLGFRKMLAAMEAGDWQTAAEEALNSKWAYQVDDGPGGRHGRADRVASLILEG